MSFVRSIPCTAMLSALLRQIVLRIGFETWVMTALRVGKRRRQRTQQDAHVPLERLSCEKLAHGSTKDSSAASCVRSRRAPRALGLDRMGRPDASARRTVAFLPRC